jgi:hypothetical protein
MLVSPTQPARNKHRNDSFPPGGLSCINACSGAYSEDLVGLGGGEKSSSSASLSARPPTHLPHPTANRQPTSPNRQPPTASARHLHLWGPQLERLLGQPRAPPHHRCVTNLIAVKVDCIISFTTCMQTAAPDRTRMPTDRPTSTQPNPSAAPRAAQRVQPAADGVQGVHLRAGGGAAP